MEFGAWDGIHLSNTRALIEEHGYSAVLIEADPGRYRDLLRNCTGFPAVFPVCDLVGFGETDGLDRILSRFPVPRTFDLLSIDVDGNDYHIWKAVRNYEPKIVCIEFNPTIPPAVEYIQPPDPAVSRGSSLSALRRLGSSKGYELISVLPSNAVFVRADLFPRFEVVRGDIEELWKERQLITYLWVGYDGTVGLHGYCRLPWHGLQILESEVQVLPRGLRRYPPSVAARPGFQ